MLDISLLVIARSVEVIMSEQMICLPCARDLRIPKTQWLRARKGGFFCGWCHQYVQCSSIDPSRLSNQREVKHGNESR